MAVEHARIAPFVNKLFYVTAKAGSYSDGRYHSGVDISTGVGSRGANLYSICTGRVIQVNYNEGGYGNYIIIKDDFSNYAFLFAHMYARSNKNIGEAIKVGELFGIEGATGNVTGLHTHVEMQNYVGNGNKWIFKSNDPSLWGTVYLDATTYMGFSNVVGTQVIYDGTIPQPTEPLKKKHFPWAIFAEKNRKSKMMRY